MFLQTKRISTTFNINNLCTNAEIFASFPFILESVDRSTQCENNLIESYLRITSVESLLAVHNAVTQTSKRGVGGGEKKIDQSGKERESEAEIK